MQRIVWALAAVGVLLGGCSDDGPEWTGCEIDGVQYGDGQVNPENACQVCDLAASAAGWSDVDGVDCDDGVYCNGADTCLAGACSEHVGDPCTDDGLYCNGAESCNETGGACEHAGSPCTAPELCSEDTNGCVLSCTGCGVDGVCYGDGQSNPQNPCQICDPAAAADSWSDDDGVGCDDGVFCNGADSCLGGACAEHAGDPCAPGGICDEDADDCVGSCTDCLIDSVCYSDGQPNPQNECQVCAPAASATGWTDNDGAGCDDGLYCTGADTCLAGACSEHAGDPCAAGEFCDEDADDCAQTCAGCEIDSACYGDGQTNPQNVCQVCDPAVSNAAWSDNDGADCDDGVYCNGADTCLAGACAQNAGDPCLDDGLYCNGAESCNETGGTCDHGGDPCTPPEICDEGTDSCGLTCPGCTIDSVCYNHRQTDPFNVCLICDVGFSTTDWTDNDGADCDDGTFCNGPDTCLAGACSENPGKACPEDDMWCNGYEYCDEDRDRCYHGGNRCTFPEICDESRNMCVLSCTGCAIDNVCYYDGQTNPLNVCQICDLATAADAWTDNDGSDCDDGAYCTGDDTCLGGTCSSHTGSPCLDDGLYCNGPEVCNEGGDTCDHSGDPCTLPGYCYEDTDVCQTEEERAQELWITSGHADASSEPFTNWDEDDPPMIPTACAKCHSTPGFIDFLEDGVIDAAAPTGTVIECTACHTDQVTGAVRDIVAVTFPSGAVIAGLGPMSLCVTCHQGRSSTPSVDAYLVSRGAVAPDTVYPSLSFRSAHYSVSAATQFGTLVKGGYEYAGRTYDGRFSHADGANDCMICHDPHSLDADLAWCGTCHTGVTDPKDIRAYGSFPDYDGDSDITEGIYYEVAGVREKLYSAIRVYAANVIGIPIGYDEATYPYFFTDSNANGVIDPSEADYGNRYLSFTPRLLRATYNYHFSIEDPGGFAHGGKYVIELLYDSLEDLNSAMGGAVSMAGMHRIDEGHFNGSSEPFRLWDEDGEVTDRCARCHSPEGLPYFLANGTDVDQELPNGLWCSSCHTAPPAVHAVASVDFPSGETVDLGDGSNLCLFCHQGRASKLDVDSKIAGGPGPYSFTSIHYSHEAAVFFGDETHGGYEYSGKVYTGRQIFTNHMGRYDDCAECHKATNTLRGVREASDHNSKTPNPADCVSCHGQDVSQPYPGADPALFSFSHIRPANVPDYDGDGNRSEALKNEIQGLEAALYAQIQNYGFAIGSPVVFDLHTYPFFFRDSNGNGLKDPGENTRYLFNANMLKAGYNYYMSRKAPFGFIHNSRYLAQLMVDSIQGLGGNIAPYTWR